MNRKIFKYELEITDFQFVQMPLGTEVKAAREQNGKLCIWALVDERNYDESKSIAIVGTGHPINFNINEFEYYYVDTVIMGNGLVFHVFAKN